MDRYQRDGLIRTVSMMVSVNIAGVPEPLQDLAPGVAGSNYSELAHILRHRWDGDRIPQKSALATRRAAKLAWGLPGKLRASDADHDALLAAVYFSRADRNLWRPGFVVADDLGWVPDAVILGNPMTVIEVGGSSYTAEKIEYRTRSVECRRILY
jgi:hypothetical protein